MPSEFGRKIFSVEQFTRELKNLVEGKFSIVGIEGELSNFKVYPSGHAYFTLKDAKSQIRGVMWKGNRSRLKFEPKDGDHVVCFGRVSVYEQRGEYQIVVESMEPKGLGALQAAFEQLKKKLSDEGLFDKERKKELPYIPWSIGIITSPKGAVIHDMIRTLNRRFLGLRIVFSPVAVQGEGSAKQIAQAICDMNEYGKVDVIIVGRGGGSLEDLWAFNEEVVARAIAQSTIPIVSAVGHETDFTIADFVADLRALTPTEAAVRVAPERAVIEEYIGDLSKRALIKIRDLYETSSQKVDDLDARSLRAVQSTLTHTKEQVKGVVRHLKALSPAATLRNNKEKVDSLMKNLFVTITQTNRVKKSEFLALNKGLHISKLTSIVKIKRNELNQKLSDLDKNATSITGSSRKRFEIAKGRLNAVSPLAVLKRGYSIVTSEDGKKVFTSSKELMSGLTVKVRMADGDKKAIIKGDGAGRQEKLF